MTRMTALLGEVEENPLLLGFDALRERLERALADLNREHPEFFAVPLTPTSEFPEFSAVLKDLTAAYPVARRLAEVMHPLSLRVAAAHGDVEAPSPDMADPPDGPAFDRAGEMLYRSRKEERFLVIQGGDETVDTLANALFLVLAQDLHRWTRRQCEIVRLYRRLHRQQDVAKELGVSQQSVSSALAAAGWRALVEVEESLARALETYGTGG